MVAVKTSTSNLDAWPPSLNLHLLCSLCLSFCLFSFSPSISFWKKFPFGLFSFSFFSFLYDLFFFSSSFFGVLFCFFILTRGRTVEPWGPETHVDTLPHAHWTPQHGSKRHEIVLRHTKLRPLFRNASNVLTPSSIHHLCLFQKKIIKKRFVYLFIWLLWRIYPPQPCCCPNLRYPATIYSSQVVRPCCHLLVNTSQRRH